MLLKIIKPAALVLSIAIAVFEYYTAVFEFVWPAQWGGNTYWQANKNNSKVIAITFDDGPSKYTTEVLKLLKEQKTKATFFLMGRQVDAFPEVAKEIAAQGHEIGNHGYGLIAQQSLDKLYLPSLPDQELLKAETSIYQATGIKPRYFRPPGGQIGRNLWRQVEQLQLTTITGILPFPEASNSAQKQLKTIADNLKPGGILILHDGDDANPESNRGQNVVELIPMLLKHLDNEGYQVVPLSELIRQ
ncbi:polysaccharide deacetylase family protein [uncultured Pseudoteredinibacter sp.]|uniref:polysaccharide deacetylase family protein n=1 Tax=uncultured Pseudoteredinibacter sp. TaxID=1641701 RepID=UPI0026253BC5|nr:polysaccharide deacetylase family protein [uncultured Pseudoteredinibacter sp.]